MPSKLKTGLLTPLVGYHLRRASGAFSTDFASALSDTGIRQPLFAILAVVDANPGINQGVVGNILGIKRANMVSLINELTERGLVERLVAPEDRRAFSLMLTGEGREMLMECARRIEAHEARMLSDFSEDERETLLGLLRRIARKA